MMVMVMVMTDIPTSIMGVITAGRLEQGTRKNILPQ